MGGTRGGVDAFDVFRRFRNPTSSSLGAMRYRVPSQVSPEWTGLGVGGTRFLETLLGSVMFVSGDVDAFDVSGDFGVQPVFSWEPCDIACSPDHA